MQFMKPAFRRMTTAISTLPTHHSPPSIKVCRNCKYASRNIYVKDDIACTKMDERDMINGNIQQFSARETRNNEKYCGHEAKWYEEKTLCEKFLFWMSNLSLNYILLFTFVFYIIATIMIRVP